MSFSQITSLLFLQSKKVPFLYVSLQRRTEQWRTKRTRKLDRADQQIPDHLWLRLHYSKLFHADEICVFMCLTKTEKEKKARETLRWFMTSCLGVCFCVCLDEKVLQWVIYDTPFTSGGASCLSFFIPRSLMGLWWWWRDGPSPLEPIPPWDEEGPPPPPPLPPEECCTLRSLLPSTRICGGKKTSTVWHKCRLRRSLPLKSLLPLLGQNQLNIQPWLAASSSR